MKKKQIQEMKSISNKLLASLHCFMNTVSPTAGRGLIGELLVFYQLLSRYEKRLAKNENNSIEFRGSTIKDFDIRLSLDQRIFNINAKGTTVRDENHHPKWVRQHTLHKFVEIDENSHVEVIQKSDERLYYVYADVQKWLDSRRADLYVLSDKEAKRKFGKKYKHLYDGKPRRTGSDDMWIQFRDICKFRDNSLSRFSKLLKADRSKKSK